MENVLRTYAMGGWAGDISWVSLVNCRGVDSGRYPIHAATTATHTGNTVVVGHLATLFLSLERGY